MKRVKKMPDRVTFIKTEQTLARILQAVEGAPMGHKVYIAPPTRSDAQNSKMWPMLGDVARAQPEDRSHSSAVWKTIFMHELDEPMKLVPSLDWQTVIPLGFSTRLLSKAKFAELITVIEQYGTTHGVQWSEPNPYEIWQ